MTYTDTEEFVIPADPTVVVSEGGSARPLPDGTKVLATILPTRKDGAAIEKRPFANTGVNSKITALSVRFRIAEGQPGANRNVFATIPLARKFASGKTVFSFYGFFRALGYNVDGDFAYPGDRELMGSEIELVLGIEQDNKGEDRNNVKFFNAPNGIPTNTATPAARQPAAPAWTPGTTTLPSAVPPAVSQSPTPGWLPPQADVDAAIQQAAASGKSF